jgi:hypothetical protein
MFPIGPRRNPEITGEGGTNDDTQTRHNAAGYDVWLRRDEWERTRRDHDGGGRHLRRRALATLRHEVPISSETGATSSRLEVEAVTPPSRKPRHVMHTSSLMTSAPSVPIASGIRPVDSGRLFVSGTNSHASWACIRMNTTDLGARQAVLRPLPAR